MKELSIEEKAKRYDEAIEALGSLFAEQAIKHCDRVYIKNITNIFPVLKESENEVMRAMAIKAVHAPEAQSCIKSWGINPDDVIAWLEKQESYYTFEIKEGHWYKCVCDYMLNGSDLMFKNDRLYYCRSNWRLRGEIDERNVKDIGVNGYKSFFRPATNQEIKDWLEKQKERGPLSKDEGYTLARIIEYLEDNNCPSKWKDLLHDVYALPYQKEQREDITRDKIAEYLKKLILDQSQRGIHMLDYEGRIEEEVDFIISIAKKELKKVEQKSADNVEPKFKKD